MFYLGKIEREREKYKERKMERKGDKETGREDKNRLIER